MSIPLVSPRVRARSTGQYYNNPVSRYRTPFEYADITQLMNDKVRFVSRTSLVRPKVRDTPLTTLEKLLK